MNLANSRATIGLTTRATPTSTSVNGNVQIGDNPQTITFPDVNVAYSIRAFFAADDPNLDLDVTTGSTTDSSPFVAGAAQVETATAAGTATADGNITTTVTSTGMAGSPLAITTAILNGDTASVWAGKVRATLAANAVIAGRFTVSGTTTAIVLTRKPGTVLNDGTETVNLFLASDASLNIALTGPAGVTAAPTSANTVAGTVTSGVLIRDGDEKDFEGVTIPTCTPKAILLVNGGTAQISSGFGLSDIFTPAGASLLMVGLKDGDDSIVSTGSETFLTVTVLAEAV
jgi:hypothetical protein